MFEATGAVHTPPPGRPNKDMLPGYTVGPTDPDRYAPNPTTATCDVYHLKADKKIETAKEKVPLGLLPMGALSGLARVFQYGAKKYAPGNFIEASLKDGAGERYISAALRHLAQMQHRSGLHTEQSVIAFDDESGLPHIDHAIASLVMLRAIISADGTMSADPKENS